MVLQEIYEKSYPYFFVVYVSAIPFSLHLIWEKDTFEWDKISDYHL